MTNSNWLKQTADSALFEDLLWSRPETKARAGKLLIIGGSSSGFSKPAEAYSSAIKAGAGLIKVALPDSLIKIVSNFIEDAVFCKTNKSGSLAKESLAQILDYALWSDMVMLSGDLSHNSETEILFESFVSKYQGPLSIADYAVDLFNANPLSILNRQKTTLVISPAKLQKLLIKAGSTTAITLNSNLIQVIDIIQKLSEDYAASIVTKHQNNLIVGLNGYVSSTECEVDKWEVELASYASVWSMQNPSKQFEALSTSAFQFVNKNPLDK